jgi:1-acyl-sn-glycerol-3-phosphate acyltransferase
LILVRTALRTFIEAFFRVFFTYESRGEEKLPRTGPAVVASNHPSYLDPLLLSLQVERPIRFMAWDALFKVPVLGGLLRAFGAFPVDIRRGQGRIAYEKARILVESGQIVGLFPEGKRSGAGWMEPSLREGAARLSWETGAPLVPATITGAFRAWPYFRSLPRPARIAVRYHDPIDPAHYRALGAEEGIPALLAELRRRVERSLLPGVKADLRTELLYRSPAPGPRLHEYGPAFALALLVFWKTRSLWPVAPAYAYIAYLLLDQMVIPQRRLVKWVRNASAVFFLLLYAHRVALPTLGLPAVPAAGALLAVLCGAFFAYLYERSRVTLGFIRGLVLAMVLGFGALYLAPTGIGPHLSLTVFATAYGWERRTVFWRYAAPLLLLYDVAVARWLDAGMEVLPHVVAGLLAWFFARFLPDGSAVVEEADPPPTHTSLGLS